MTDNTTNIDVAKLTELVNAYSEADSEKERREIENEVLEATVWSQKEPQQREAGFAVYSASQVEAISQYVTDPSEEVKRLLRKPYLSYL